LGWSEKGLDIRGVQKISFIDFPGEICLTIFVGGCNLRCRYCHNKDLVLNPTFLPPVPEVEIFKFLAIKGPLLDGICISGGEPTLQEDLVDFTIRAKRKKFKVKLDTNGTSPRKIDILLQKELLDYIAVDIKGPPHKYPLITGKEGYYSTIAETINLLRSSTLDYEFRTTVVPGLLEEKDVLEIARELDGCRKYVLQQFYPSKGLIDSSLNSVKTFNRERAAKLANKCRDYIKDVQLRGF
jgi:pyruvate formate lyase activating enzyme